MKPSVCRRGHKGAFGGNTRGACSSHTDWGECVHRIHGGDESHEGKRRGRDVEFHRHWDLSCVLLFRGSSKRESFDFLSGFP